MFFGFKCFWKNVQCFFKMKFVKLWGNDLERTVRELRELWGNRERLWENHMRGDQDHEATMRTMKGPWHDHERTLRDMTMRGPWETPYNTMKRTVRAWKNHMITFISNPFHQDTSPWKPSVWEIFLEFTEFGWVLTCPFPLGLLDPFGFCQRSAG